MKEKLITFSIIFAGSFALNYFFASDRDIAGMFFVSAGAAAIGALTEKYMIKLVVNTVRKIVKPHEQGRE